MGRVFSLGADRLTVDKLVAFGKSPNPPVAIEKESATRLLNNRRFVEQSVQSNARVYGVNTGFGFLADVCIKAADLQQLQLNLIRSHASGVGDDLTIEMARSLLVLKAHGFMLGHSGVTLPCVETVLNFLKHDIVPAIPIKGSVGASGDLAPLAHLALALIGEGPVYYKGRRMPAAEALADAGFAKLVPQSKEGLSLINGTQFMATLGAFAVEQSQNLMVTANIAAALSLDAIRGSLAPFDVRIQDVRPHPGQKRVAEMLRRLLSGSDEVMSSHKDCGKVQDPYSFRCVPQVHGASWETIDHVQRVIEVELNSVTDNPLVFTDGGGLLSGGNFHGQPVALVLDFLAIAVAELGSIAERRIEKMTNPQFSGLPPFLARDSGLNSGYMIPHVTAAALVSENKTLAHPASVDSIPTSADKEDHVSMGAFGANKVLTVVRNVANILAIELLAACQALDLLKPLKPSPTLQMIYNQVRNTVPYSEHDVALAEPIALVAEMILRGEFSSLLKGGMQG